MSKVKRLETPHGRVYVYEDGTITKFMPSVTTILAFEPSPYLQELEAKIGKEELKRIGARAAGRGSAMHKFLENYMICIKNGGHADTCLLYTQKKTIKDLEEEGFERDRIGMGRDLFYNFVYENIFDDVKKVLFTEKFLWSLKHLFAGTTDFGYLSLNDKIIITDFKSASGIRGADVIKKYKKQLAAYTLAFEENHNKKVHEAQIWISHPAGVQIETTSGEEMEQMKRDFLVLCDQFHAQWEIKPFEEYYKELQVVKTN